MSSVVPMVSAAVVKIVGLSLRGFREGVVVVVTGVAVRLVELGSVVQVTVLPLVSLVVTIMFGLNFVLN